MWHRLDQSHDVRPADTHPRYMEAIDAQVIQQSELVCRVDVPTVCGANGGHRLAGIALIHRNDAILWRQLLNGIPWGPFPERRRRAHPSRRDEQHRKSRAMLFVVQLDIIAFEYWHVCSHP